MAAHEPGIDDPVSVLVQWTQDEGSDIRSARVYLAESLDEADDAGWRAMGDFPGDTAILDGLMPGRRYRVGVAGIGGDGVVPPETQWQIEEIVPASGDGPALPDTPTEFGISQDLAVSTSRGPPPRTA